MTHSGSWTTRLWGALAAAATTTATTPSDDDDDDEWALLQLPPLLVLPSSVVHQSQEEALEEQSTLKQFALDAPRMSILVDGVRWRGTPEALFSAHFCAWLPRSNALVAAEFCTQTALAPYFCAVQEKLQALSSSTCNSAVHFVDGGRQQIAIDSKARGLRIDKPFKVVDFDDNEVDCRVLCGVLLRIHVDLVTGIVLHRFYEAPRMFAAARGDSDDEWVVLGEEEDAEEEEEGLVLLVGPQHIASRVAAWRRSSRV